MRVNDPTVKNFALFATVIGGLVYVFSVPGSWLVGTRVALLSVGILAIMCYMSESRTRALPTVLAILVAGSSLAMIFQGLTNYIILSAAAEPWLVVYILAQTCVLVCNGGNTAKSISAIASKGSRA